MPALACRMQEHKIQNSKAENWEFHVPEKLKDKLHVLNIAPHGPPTTVGTRKATVILCQEQDNGGYGATNSQALPHKTGGDTAYRMNISFY